MLFSFIRIVLLKIFILANNLLIFITLLDSTQNKAQRWAQ